MKARKPPSYIQAIIIILIMAIIMATPIIWVSFGNRPKNGEQKLAITIRYTNASEGFVIARDIVVATDWEYKNVIDITSCVSGVDGRYFYRFDSPSVDELDNIYIQSPILYVPRRITPIDVPLAIGQVAEMSAKDVDFESAGNDWFAIDDVHIEETSDGYYKIKVIIKTNAIELPRLPKLKIGDKEIVGEHNLQFDEIGFLQYGEFTYRVKTDVLEDVTLESDCCYLVVDEALVLKEDLGMHVETNLSDKAIYLS